MRGVAIPKEVRKVLDRHLDTIDKHLLADMVSLVERVHAESQLYGIHRAAQFVSNPGDAKKLNDVNLRVHVICPTCFAVSEEIVNA